MGGEGTAVRTKATALSGYSVLNDSQVKQHLSEVLHQVLKYRPSDPWLFIQQYFANVKDGIVSSQRAYSLIRAVPVSSAAFTQAVAQAYAIMAVNQRWTGDRSQSFFHQQRKQSMAATLSEFGTLPTSKKKRASIAKLASSIPSAQEKALRYPTDSELQERAMHILHDTSGKDGVRGEDFTQLLGMLCSDFSPQARDTLLSCFHCGLKDAVTFQTFRAGILACCQYDVFLKTATALFAQLDPDDSGTADRDLCEAILTLINTNEGKPDVVASTIHKIQTDPEHSVLKSTEMISKADFLRSASTLYLSCFE
eukprot:m.58149 g.58149  ORF g.58149 m.58149 type:complete len:310 (-) comp11655_c0_seq8:557-1486(-)